jgi:hypothetical protein
LEQQIEKNFLTFFYQNETSNSIRKY